MDTISSRLLMTHQTFFTCLPSVKQREYFNASPMVHPFVESPDPSEFTSRINRWDKLTCPSRIPMLPVPGFYSERYRYSYCWIRVCVMKTLNADFRCYAGFVGGGKRAFEMCQAYMQIFTFYTPFKFHGCGRTPILSSSPTPLLER